MNGVRCPSCDGAASLVLSVRRGAGYVRRRHACLTPACQLIERRYGCRLVKGVRWTTYEFLSPRRGVIAVPRDTRAIRSVSTSNL